MVSCWAHNAGDNWIFESPLVLASDLQLHSTHCSSLVPPSRISFRKLLGMAKGKSAGVSCMWTSYTRKVQKGQMGNSVGLQAQNQTIIHYNLCVYQYLIYKYHRCTVSLRISWGGRFCTGIIDAGEAILIFN